MLEQYSIEDFYGLSNNVLHVQGQRGYENLQLEIRQCNSYSIL